MIDHLLPAMALWQVRAVRMVSLHRLSLSMTDTTQHLQYIEPIVRGNRVSPLCECSLNRPRGLRAKFQARASGLEAGGSRGYYLEEGVLIEEEFNGKFVGITQTTHHWMGPVCPRTASFFEVPDLSSFPVTMCRPPHIACSPPQSRGVLDMSSQGETAAAQLVATLQP